MKEGILSVVRSVLVAVFAYLAARGVIAEDAAQALVAAVVTIAAAIYDFIATRNAVKAAEAKGVASVV